jgi:hypothetical protein
MPQVDSLDKGEVETLVIGACAPFFGRARDKQELHTLLQRAIVTLSSNFGLIGVKEYVLPGFRGDRDGRLDVVWLSKTTPAVAFEIDSGFRAKSFRKLLTVKADLLFWVCYGKTDLNPIVKRMNPAGIIHVIHLHCLPKQKPAPESQVCTNQTVTPKSSADLQEVRPKRFAELRLQYPKAYISWTAEEDELLRKRFGEGQTIRRLSEQFQRKPGAIRSRLRKLGLKLGL